MDESLNELKGFVGHLKVKTRHDVTGRQRLLNQELTFELDGVDIGSRLAYLKLEITPDRCVVAAEITLYLTDIELDLPAALLLVTPAEPNEMPVNARFESDTVAKRRVA